MRKLRRPRPGDSSLSAKDLGALYDEVERLGKLSFSGGMSSGPGGIALTPLGDDVEAIKLVRPVEPLWGAWGGFSDRYGNVALNTLAKSYGTFIYPDTLPNATQKTRIIYPVDATVSRVTADRIEDTQDVIKVVNLSSYPFYNRGYVLVSPIGNDVYTPISRFEGSGDTCGQIMLDDAVDGTGFIPGVAEFEAKFIRGTNVGAEMTAVDATPQRFAHVSHAHKDLFIHSPGCFEVTYGAELYWNPYYPPESGAVPLSSQVTKTATVPGVAGGGSHLHQIDLTNGQGFPFYLHLVRNFIPTGSPITISNFQAGTGTLHIRGVVPPLTPPQCSITVEKTEVIQTSLDNYHGQPYTRLSLVVSHDTFGFIPSVPGKKIRIAVNRAWIKVAIKTGNGQGADACGYNAFLGPKTDFWKRGFQWWGGGPEPVKFGRDGLVIP